MGQLAEGTLDRSPAGSMDIEEGGRPRSLGWVVAVNVVGGTAVLGSYVLGLAGHPESRGALWGGVPEAMLPAYTTNMFLAAAGYLALAWHIVFVLMRHGARVAGRDVGQVALPLFLAVLVPSALWLPLTFDMIAAPSAALWWTIRGVLALVAIGSLGLWAVAAFARPVGSTKTRLGAVIGGAFFCLQTVVLDAIVWTALYPFG